MPRYQTDQGVFSFSVKGIMIHEGKVLLCSASIDDFWSIPGGTTEFDENSEMAVVREFREESGFPVSVVRLLWVAENFFEHNEEKHHCIEWYFLVVPDGNEAIWEQTSFPGVEENYLPAKYGSIDLTFKWFALDRIDSINLKPDFLKSALKTIPETPLHVVNREV